MLSHFGGTGLAGLLLGRLAKGARTSSVEGIHRGVWKGRMEGVGELSPTNTWVMGFPCASERVLLDRKSVV